MLDAAKGIAPLDPLDPLPAAPVAVAAGVAVAIAPTPPVTGPLSCSCVHQHV